jgi:hypothetical protein
MLNFKNFTLRRRKTGFWISSEKRPIIGWHGSLWKYKSLKLSRPEAGIVVVECGPGDCSVFTPMELPNILPETAQKTAERDQKKRQRKEIRDKKRAQQKEKKGTVKRSSKKAKKDKEIEELYPSTQDPSIVIDSLSDIPPAVYLKNKA